MALALLFIAAYLLGSIPVGLLVAQANGIDIRKIGSGNIGATNVKRALGNKWAAVVFVLDFLKGLGPTMASRQIDDRQWIWFLVGFAAVLGHVTSPFVGFKGGKGVATSLGMVAGSAPLVALVGLITFIVVFLASGFVSLASIIGVVSANVAGALIPNQSRYLMVGYAILLLFVIYTHRENIKRLRNGTENKFTFKKKEHEKGQDEEGPSN